MRYLLLSLILWGCDDEAGAEAVRDGAAPDAPTPTADAQRGGDGAASDARVARDGALVDAAGDARVAPPRDGAVDGTTPDAAPLDGAVAADAAAADAGAPDPLPVPAGAWTWLPLEGMRCANGTPTGIGVNLAPGGADRVFIYLFGGGACWDEASCYRDNRAAFIEAGFGPADFPGESLSQFWFFNRGAAENPFADHHLVLVPYCTGDIHGGNQVAMYGGRPTHHVGAVNFERVARRLHAAWPDLTRVVLAGGSAGGFGALLNWHRAQALFPGARVDLIDDGGAAIPPPQFPVARRAQWSVAWNFAATLPADCPGCLADWELLVPYNLARSPTSRAALLTSMRDAVIAQYMGVSEDTFERGVAALVDRAPARSGAFLIPGNEHVLMAGPYLAGGQTVPQWLRAMQADDPAWGTVGPDPLPPCDTFATCNECAVCASQGPCAAEFGRCNGLRGCVEAVVCALGCAAEDVACIATCGAPFPGVGEAALALYGCVRCGQCGEDCGACP